MPCYLSGDGTLCSFQKLGSDQINSTTDIDHFTAYCRDRTGKSRGGILVCTKDSLASTRRHDLEDERIECLTIELPATRSKQIISAVTVVRTSLPMHSLMFYQVFFCRRAPTICNCSSRRLQRQAFIVRSTINSQLCWYSNVSTLFGLLTYACFRIQIKSASTIDLICTARQDVVSTVRVSDPISDHSYITAHLS